MLRKLFVVVVTLILTSYPLTAVLSSEPQEPRELPIYIKGLTDKIELLEVRVTELEKEIATLKNRLGFIAIDFDDGSQLLLPVPIELPPQDLPPARNLIPWNYDTGLYIFPNSDGKVGRGGTGKE
jgi:hypothetical protein